VLLVWVFISYEDILVIKHEKHLLGTKLSLKEAESRLKSSFLGAEWVMSSLKRAIMLSMLLLMSSILGPVWSFRRLCV